MAKRLVAAKPRYQAVESRTGVPWAFIAVTHEREASQRWEVTVEREGQTVVLRPKELVMALGVSGYASVPQIPGAECFLGEQHHSSKHAGPEVYAGTCSGAMIL